MNYYFGTVRWASKIYKQWLTETYASNTNRHFWEQKWKTG